jgi:ATP-binding cassette subfamily A (ABC1) protein 3
MTIEEHIRYVARLKGVKEEKISELAKYYYEILNLTPYIKVKAGNLSGGNKRKLCVSMAMLANPKIMLLDEPSSGLDPISRRFLWKSLYMSARTKDATMILTTHTMS